MKRSDSVAQCGELAEPEVPLAGAQEVAVGEPAALGTTGGARRVEKRALRGTTDRLRGQARRQAGRRHAADDIGTHRLEGQVGLGGGGAQQGLAPRLRHCQAHLAVADDVGPLGGAHVGMDRHDAHAERVQRQPVGEEGRPVLEQKADAVAVAVAGLSVGGAQPLDLAGHLAPAARARLDAVGLGGDGLDAEEIGVAAPGGDALESFVDSRHAVQMKSCTAGSAASQLIMLARLSVIFSAPPTSTRW